MAYSFATHPDVSEILQVPGLLFTGPTAFDAEAHWGTKLGYCKNGVFFDPGYQVEEVHQEEAGEAVWKVFYLGSIPRIFAILRNWNATALGQFFPGLVTGSALNFPGSLKPGAELSSATYSKKLLFVPDDAVNNPCCYMNLACPHIQQTAKLALSHSNKMEFPAVWTGILSGSRAYVGPLSGASL